MTICILWMPVVPCDKQKIRLDVTFYASFFMIIHKSVQISFITWVVCLFGVCGTNSIPFHWFITCCLFQLQWWYDLWCIQNKNRFFCIQIQTPFHLIYLNPSTHKFETTMIMFIENNNKQRESMSLNTNTLNYILYTFSICAFFESSESTFSNICTFLLTGGRARAHIRCLNFISTNWVNPKC